MSKKFLRPPLVLLLLMAVTVGLAYLPVVHGPWLGFVIIPLLFLAMLVVVGWHFIHSARRAIDWTRRIGTPEERRIFGFRSSRVFLVIGIVVLAALVCSFPIGEMMTRRMPLYKEALRDVRASQEGRQLLGTDIQAGWLSSSRETMLGEEGTIEIEIPLHGERGKGTMFVNGSLSNGDWRMVDLYLVLNESTSKIEISH